MATMADVARRAGVSVATVSHVLNDTRPVLPGTRQAVLDAIDALGYTPNTLARSLVTARTRSIGLAVSAISNPYFTEILQGVEAGALEHGYGLLIADPHDDPGHERKVVQLLHERRVDGMIVAPSAEPGALLDYLTPARRYPTVFLDRLVDDPADDLRYDQVGAENTASTVDGWSRHLAELGHTAHRPGRGPARAEHHRRADRRLPRTASRRPGCRTTTELRGARRLRGGRRRATPPTGCWPLAGAAHRARHRQQRDDHRRAARPARPRASPCRTTWRCAASTTSPGPICSRPGSPRSPSPARRSAPRRSGCCWNGWRARTGRRGPCGCPAPSSTARRAAAPEAPSRPTRRVPATAAHSQERTRLVIVVAGEALIDLVPQGAGALRGACRLRAAAAAPTTRRWRSAGSARPPRSAPASRTTPSARRCSTDCGTAGVDVSLGAARRGADHARRRHDRRGRLGRLLLLRRGHRGPAVRRPGRAPRRGTRAVSFGTCSLVLEPGASAYEELLRTRGRAGRVHRARPEHPRRSDPRRRTPTGPASGAGCRRCRCSSSPRRTPRWLGGTPREWLAARPVGRRDHPGRRRADRRSPGTAR